MTAKPTVKCKYLSARIFSITSSNDGQYKLGYICDSRVCIHVTENDTTLLFVDASFAMEQYFMEYNRFTGEQNSLDSNNTRK